MPSHLAAFARYSEQDKALNSSGSGFELQRARVGLIPAMRP
jgi:hypothetical protein